MTGDEVRQVFEALWPQEEIDGLCQQFGVIERQRKLHLGMFVRAMVLSAGTPGGASQADGRRSSLECEVPHVARSACYRWFDAPLEQCMAALADRVLAYARAQQVDRSGPLRDVTDWSIVESTTVTGRDALHEECPGTGDAAAIKGHQVLAVGCGAPVRYHCSPAREHDSRPLTIDESWRGYGLLADLAYARLARLRAGDAHGVRCVIRRTDTGKPTVHDLARGQVTQTFFPGTDLDALLAAKTLVLDGRAMDADGHVGGDTHALHRRRVGVHTPKGDGVFRTHLPPRMGPRQVADLYRVRWEVERSLRLDKSVHRLDEVDSARPCSLTTLLHAALLASTIAALLAHTHTLKTRPPQVGAPRTEAPRHPRRLALQLAVSGPSIAHAFDLQGAEAPRRWDKIAALRTPSGKDPNWRRRPSILDQWRGWTRQLRARTKTHGGDVTHRNFKAAA
jgi:putative transposase